MFRRDVRRRKVAAARTSTDITNTAPPATSPNFAPRAPLQLGRTPVHEPQAPIMIRRPQLFQPARVTSTTQQCIRSLHMKYRERPVPQPTRFCPDVPTFLTLIGRKVSQHADKIPTWKDLFTMSSEQMRDAGIEPARSRRYIINWREKFRNGEYGVGGDAEWVNKGFAHVKVIQTPVRRLPERLKEAARREVPLFKGLRPRRSAFKLLQKQNGASKFDGQLATVNTNAGHKKIVVSATKDRQTASTEMKHLKVIGAGKISGRGVELIKGFNGTFGRIKATEGLWEDRRGHKVDGGERRRAEVRAKKRAAANRE
ncbi:IGR protein motif-domain-containing protein [Phyllosticta paracitricarpa]|uniref:Small ribosomal subunit protein mS41 n=2 Tax=Phyllosticta TaxID=121621 RepID=A0ABR1NBU6_9PEZI